VYAGRPFGVDSFSPSLLIARTVSLIWSTVNIPMYSVGRWCSLVSTSPLHGEDPRFKSWPAQ